MPINNDSVVYISGPMSGLPDYGRQMMKFVESFVKENFPDATVINPADVPPEWTWEQAMEKDVDDVSTNATVMVLLDGWEKSRGARIEVGIALRRNLEIVMFRDLMAEKFKGTVQYKS